MTDQKLKTLGCLKVLVKRDNVHLNAEFIIVKSEREYGLIGRDLIDASRSNVCTFAVDDEYLPTIKGFSAGISLIDNTKPFKFLRTRPVPIQRREQLDQELLSLQKQGIITQVASSTCASPVVWVRKANGRFRLCRFQSCL